MLLDSAKVSFGFNMSLLFLFGSIKRRRDRAGDQVKLEGKNTLSYSDGASVELVQIDSGVVHSRLAAEEEFVGFFAHS